SVNARAAIVDSIKANIQSIENELSKGNSSKELQRSYQHQIEIYNIKRQQFDQMNAEQAEEYDKQIYSQINQYIEDYGKDHNYLYILGANGSGSILYAKERHDLTQELINYINEKYAGK